MFMDQKDQYSENEYTTQSTIPMNSMKRQKIGH